MGINKINRNSHIKNGVLQRVNDVTIIIIINIEKITKITAKQLKI
jgi:hypothetical protein